MNHLLLLRLCAALRIQFGFGRSLFLLFLIHLHHMRAIGLVVIQHLAVQALDTFVGVDVTLRMNRLHRAIVRTALAGIAAHLIAAQPVKHAQTGGNRQRRAKRAQIAAIKALDKQPGQQQHHRKRHKPPFADKFQNNRGFERLHFRQFFRQT